MVIFAETGFVVTPFRPGDSLLFIAGSLAALGAMDVHLLFVLLFIAAVAGKTLNDEFGRWLGPKVFNQQQSRWLNPHHIVLRTPGLSRSTAAATNIDNSGNKKNHR